MPRRSATERRGCWAGIVAAGLAAGGGLLPGTSRPANVPTAFVLDPPRVASLEVQLAPHGDPPTAEVFIRFMLDPRLPPQLELDLGGPPFRLTAVPGTEAEYTGTTPLDPRTFLERQQRLAVLARELKHPLTHPEFVGREKVGTVPVPKFPVPRLIAGERVALVRTWVSDDEINAGRSLLITDRDVVTDAARTYNPCDRAGAPMGKWTFGHLMEQLAAASGAPDSAAFTRSWLAHWESVQTVNQWPVQPRPNLGVQILDSWPRKPNTTQLDLARAPFFLLAIVNRIDLAGNVGYGAGGAGEGRFVFGALSPSCVPLRFTVIFEYAIRTAGCFGIRNWARQWVDLAQVSPSGLSQALEAVTDQFTSGGNGLAQLRTNEIALDAEGPDQTWEMREFVLSSGQLDQTTVKRTPDTSLNHDARIADYANGAAADILLDRHTVPDSFPPGSRFLGGSSLVQLPTFFWTGPQPGTITAPEVRHHFSLNTCNGCHTGETGTLFTHVNPLADLGSPRLLSGFLKGTRINTQTGLEEPFTVSDPETGTVRTFHDLQRRAVTLARFANLSCLFLFFHEPLRMTH